MQCMVLSAGTLACATMSGLNDKFDIASRSYNRAVRWGDVDKAMAYLPPESVPGFLAEREDADEEINIVDYERLRVSVDPTEAEGFSRVVVHWHYDDSLVIETSVVDQVWQYYNGAWVLVDEWQVKGEPLFIFAERDEAEPETPHPYLPGLSSFRETRMIGLSDAEKRKRIREAKRAGTPATPSEAAVSEPARKADRTPL